MIVIFCANKQPTAAEAQTRKGLVHLQRMADFVVLISSFPGPVLPPVALVNVQMMEGAYSDSG